MGIKGGNDSPKQWNIGVPFLRQYYTIWEFSSYNPSSSTFGSYGAGRIGIATKLAVAIVSTPTSATGATTTTKPNVETTIGI